MRVVLPLVAVLGLLAGVLSVFAPDDEWRFVPPESPPALLLETRKHLPPPDGAASERSDAIAVPRRAATPLGAAGLQAERASFLPRYPDRRRPDATGPPAPLRLAAR